MLDIKWIRENPAALDEALLARGAEPISARLIELDERRRKQIAYVQTLQTRRNEASKDIGKAKAAGDTAAAEAAIAEIAVIKSSLQSDEYEERMLTMELDDLLGTVPNVPLSDVPIGADERGNIEIRRFGELPNFTFAPTEHFEIGEALGLMDFDQAAKISGSRFTVLKGGLARLERALGQFMLDLHTTVHGYQEVGAPILVKAEALYGTNQLPKFEDDLFTTTKRLDNFELKKWASDIVLEDINSQDRQKIEEFLDDPNSYFELLNRIAKTKKILPVDQMLYLIPTSEVPLTNLVREQTLDEAVLPLRFTALTPCFRSEAGSAGRDTRGMLRQHQFYKVELVSITAEDASIEEHERMTRCAEEVLKRLGLPFRTVVLCTGDMGFGARKTYDIEVWLPGQNAYREISSCSVCGDFQARRMSARYKVSGEKQARFVHTLNGSGVAVGRCLIAILENYQNEDGSVTIPEALRPYMGGLERIERAA